MKYGSWKLDLDLWTVWGSHGTSFDCERELVQRVAILPVPATEATEANGRLIAAAPDLLEAATYMVNVAQMNDPARWERGHDMLRAAIAKAGG